MRTLLKVDIAKATPIPPGGVPVPDNVQALLNLLNLDLGPPLGPVGAVTWQPDMKLNGQPIGISRYGFQFPDDAVVVTVGRKPTEVFFWTHNPEIQTHK